MAKEQAIAVVSGGASGMGLACVRKFQQLGMQLLVWDVNPCPEDGVHSILCDVSDALSVENAMRETLEVAGRPRVAVCCAGIAPAKRMLGKAGAMPLDLFKQVIDVNLIGSFNVMRVVAAAMAEAEIHADTQERGVIIHTASIAAYEGQIGQTAYSASKGGIVSMVLPAARELARHAIRVNAVAPGLIATPLLLNMPEEVQESLKATLTFPRRFGQPEEFAELVSHIVNNQMINGEVIRLDGALRMQAG